MATDFAAVARLLANPARSAVVDALMEGRPLAAGELARLAGVRPSTVSEHLAALVDGGLLAVVNAGRHRYFQLAGAHVAEALEALALICPTTPVKSLRQANGSRAFRTARSCYDHLAGALGVAVLERMVGREWLVPGLQGSGAGYEVGPDGDAAFARLGVDVQACRNARRQFARPCLDWTQRRSHLAGALGAAVLAALLDCGWVRRTTAGRGLLITPGGVAGVREMFAIDVADLDSSTLDGAAPLDPDGVAPGPG
ncbi:winged helix-turn-helix domain-containing protein [Actinopolymorpha sp. B17G11]|uniref:ArsR/SmtB family transcription factor n=1 Tax=unclassified Actinopolymorpha TaxID=2627063 RepID=UPI0032D8DE87